MGALVLGFPLWLLLSVLVVFALILYYMLGGRVSEWVRVPLAVLRNTDCLSSAPAQDPAGDHARYDASRDDRPYSISDGVPHGIAHSVPDRLTLRFCDCVTLRADWGRVHPSSIRCKLQGVLVRRR